MSERNQRFSKGQTKHDSEEHSHFAWSWGKEDSIPKPLTQESSVTKSLRVERKSTFPTLGKVTLPRGKLECRSYHAKTSRNQIPDVDLGAVLPRRASGCVGCRRKGKRLGLLGFKLRSRRKSRPLERQSLSNLACLKGIITRESFGEKAEPWESLLSPYRLTKCLSIVT